MLNITKLHQTESLIELAEDKYIEIQKRDAKAAAQLRRELEESIGRFDTTFLQNSTDDSITFDCRRAIEQVKNTALMVRLETFDLNDLLSKAAVYQVENTYMRLGQTLINCTPNDIVALMPKGVSREIFGTHDDIKATQLYSSTLNLEKA